MSDVDLRDIVDNNDSGESIDDWNTEKFFEWVEQQGEEWFKGFSPKGINDLNWADFDNYAPIGGTDRRDYGPVYQAGGYAPNTKPIVEYWGDYLLQELQTDFALQKVVFDNKAWANI